MPPGYGKCLSNPGKKEIKGDLRPSNISGEAPVQCGVCFFPNQVTYFSQVLWMSVMGLGKSGPSSHFEPASQPATQPALEQASQSFLKGL